MIGVRSLDEDEAAAWHMSAIRRVGVTTLRHELPTVLAERGIAQEGAYLHGRVRDRP